MARIGQLNIDVGMAVARLSRDLERARAKINTWSAKVNKAVGGASRGFKSFKQNLFSIQGLLQGAAIGGGIRTMAEFGEKMSEVAAVSRATTKELEAMRAQAKQLGAETSFSASEAAGGLAFLARAGFNANQAMAALPATLDLAASGGLGLAEAADIASNIMQGFAASANEASRFADVLAETAANSNTNIQQLGEAMKLAAPVAHSMGVSVEEASAAVGVLSNAGLQATMAGTGLRRVLVSLANPTDELKQLMGGLTVQQDGLNAVMAQLAKQNISTGEAMEIFGDRGGTAFLIMQDAVGTMDQLTGKLQGSEGAAKQMAKTMNDNLMGSIRELMSAVEGFIITLGDSGLTKVLRTIIGSLAELARWLSKITVQFRDGVAAAVIELQAALGLIDRDVADSALLKLSRQADDTTERLKKLNAEAGKLPPKIAIPEDGDISPAGSSSTSSDRKKEMERKAIRVLSQTRTEAEKFQSEIKDLNEMVNSGAIDWDTYNRAVQQAQADLSSARSEMDVIGDVTNKLLDGQIQGWKDVGRVAVDALKGMLDNLIKVNSTASQTGNIFSTVAGSGGGFFGGSGFNLGEIANNLASAFFFHGGGKVGSGGQKRQVNPMVFAGAQRFHDGGFPGLSRDEVPAILKKGERVLTEQQQRDMGGGSSGSTFYIDARGATKSAIDELFMRINQVDNSIENRSVSAVRSARFRDPKLFGGKA